MTEALINHIWQSTLFLLAAATLTLAFRGERARVRFAIWMIASVKFLIPFAPLIALGATLHGQVAPGTHVVPALPSTLGQIGEIVQPGGLLQVVGAGMQPAAPAHAQMHWGSWALWTIYLTGLLAVIYFRAREWLRLRAIVWASSPLSIQAPIPVWQTTATLEPALWGIVWPVLLLPARATEELTPEQLHAVLTHELCHWRRRDNLTAAVHMLVEALFWFHPLIWWLSARLMSERETACDEAVIESGTDRKTYAESILKVCRLYHQPSLSCTPAISGGSLRHRIEDIMTSPVALTLPPAKRVLLSVATLAAVAGPFALGMMDSRPTLAQTGSPSAAARVAQVTPPATPGMVIIDPSIYDDYVGIYQLPDVIVSVSRRGNRLFIQVWGALQGTELFPTGPMQFFNRGGVFTFRAGADGHAAGFNLAQGSLVFTAPRIDQATAQAYMTAVHAKVEAQTPSSGSETALSKYWASLLAGRPDYEDLGPAPAEIVRKSLQTILAGAQQLGPIQSAQLRGIGRMGDDVYLLTLVHGSLNFSITMAPDGKIQFFRAQAAPVPNRAPQPGSEASIRKYWASLLAGTPNYDDMGPVLAAAVHQQAPQLLAEARRLGPIQSIEFRGVTTTGEDEYDARYEHGSIVIWHTTIDADGKVLYRDHRPL